MAEEKGKDKDKDKDKGKDQDQNQDHDQDAPPFTSSSRNEDKDSKQGKNIKVSKTSENENEMEIVSGMMCLGGDGGMHAALRIWASEEDEADSIKDDMSEIIPGLLFLGSTLAAREQVLQRHRIDCVVNCAAGEIRHIYKDKTAPWFKDGNVCKLHWHDLECQNLFPDMIDAFGFLQACLAKKQRVLVHCVEGRSRSVSVVLFYLIKTTGKHVHECLATVQKLRPIARPNPAFMRQLEQYCEEMEIRPSAST